MRRTSTIALTAALCMPLTLLASAPASATSGAPDRIAEVIDTAAPTGDAVVQPDASTQSSFTFSGASTVVEAPVDPSKPVLLGTPEGAGLEISLPTEINVNNGVLASDGSVVYTDRTEGVHAAVQALDDGAVRLQTVLETPEAPKTYTYDLGEGVIPSLLDDGSVELLVDLEDGVRASVGVLDAPWAVDADGRDVETWYTVEGASVVQHVAHGEGSAYPITADPKGSVTWWNTTLYFNRAETRLYGAGAGSVGTVSAWFPTVPTVAIGRVLQIHAATFAVYYAKGSCGKFVMYGHLSAPIPQPYGGSEAGGYCK